MVLTLRDKWCIHRKANRPDPRKKPKKEAKVRDPYANQYGYNKPYANPMEDPDYGPQQGEKPDERKTRWTDAKGNVHPERRRGSREEEVEAAADPGGHERTQRERDNYPEGPKPPKSSKDDGRPTVKSNEFRTFTKNLNSWANDLINKLEFEPGGKVIIKYPSESKEMPGGKIKHPKRIVPDRGENKPKKEGTKKPKEHTQWGGYDRSYRKEINPTRYEYDLHHQAEHTDKIQRDIKHYKKLVEGQRHTDKPGRGLVEGSEQAERPHSYSRTQDPVTHETTTTGKSPYLTTGGKIPHGLMGKIEELKNPKKDKKPEHYSYHDRFGQHPTSTGTPATHHVGPGDLPDSLKPGGRKNQPYISDEKHKPLTSGRPNIREGGGYQLTEEEQESKPYKAARAAEAKREAGAKFEAHNRKVNPTLYQSENPYKKGEPGYEMEEYFRSPEYKKKSFYIQWLEKEKKYQDVGPIKDQSSSEQKRQAKIVQEDLTLNARKYEGSHAEKEDEYIKNQRTDPLSHAAQKSEQFRKIYGGKRKKKSYDQIIKEAEASLLNKKRNKKLTEEQQEQTDNEKRSEEEFKKDQAHMAYMKKQPKDDWGRTRPEGETLLSYPAEKSYDQIIKDAEAYIDKINSKQYFEDNKEDLKSIEEAKKKKRNWQKVIVDNKKEKSDVEHGKYGNVGREPNIAVSTDTKVDVPESTGYEERPHISVEEAGKLPRTTFNPHGNNELHVSGSQSGKDQPKFNQPTSQNQPVRKVGVPEQHPNSYGVRYGMKGGVKKVWCPEHQIWEETTKDWHD